jgi:hypothetical protein
MPASKTAARPDFGGGTHGNVKVAKQIGYTSARKCPKIVPVPAASSISKMVQCKKNAYSFGMGIACRIAVVSPIPDVAAARRSCRETCAKYHIESSVGSEPRFLPKTASGALMP